MAKVNRLYEQIKPEVYHLMLTPDLAKFSFEADETVEFELVQPSRELVWHAVGLDIKEVTVDGTAAEVKLDAKTQTVTLALTEELPKGKHSARFVFSGAISDSLHGFYRSRYEQGGQEKWLATTQFEAVHAREALVCIDEPAAKAVFELTLVIDEQLMAISNTEVVSSERVGTGQQRVRFAPTPKMSTYLLAFLVGDFEYEEGTTAEGVKVRVLATPGKKEQMGFALEVGLKTLSFFSEYFDIDYPLSKLDMVAIPDFAAGAMENWGLVTYRDVSLLLDPAQATLGNRQRVAEVVAHELAHQWFGNLVTMAWWNDLWLNEGFASWIEVLAQDKLFPEWQVWTQFVAGDIASAMDLDSLANTHPIEVEVEDPRQLDEIFDRISYAKGASVIHMLYGYLGETVFRDGLRSYLKRHAYGNATTADLWSALEEAAGRPVTEVMSAWTSQPGFPLVSLADGQVSQERFFASPAEAARVKDRSVWPIPLAGLIDGGTTDTKLLTEASAPAGALGKAIKLNPGQAGFYRVRYDQSQIESLTPLLTGAKLSPMDRFGLVADVYAAAGAGLTSSLAALTLTQALRQESDYIVWSAVSGGYGELISFLPDGPVYDQAQKFGGWLVEPNVSRLGWTGRANEPYFDQLMRPLVLQQAVRFDHAEVVKTAQERFEKFLTDPTTLEPDLRPAVYYAVAHTGTAKEFDTFLKLYLEATVSQEKMRLLNTLCRFRQPELISRSLELGLDTEKVRSQDTIYVLIWNLLRREGRQPAWDFMQQQWDELERRYGGGGHMLEAIPNYVGQAFSDREHAAQVKDFFARHPHPALTRPVAQAVESILQRADWYDRDDKAIADWLEQAPSR